MPVSRRLCGAQPLHDWLVDDLERHGGVWAHVHRDNFELLAGQDEVSGHDDVGKAALMSRSTACVTEYSDH